MAYIYGLYMAIFMVKMQSLAAFGYFYSHENTSCVYTLVKYCTAEHKTIFFTFMIFMLTDKQSMKGQMKKQQTEQTGPEPQRESFWMESNYLYITEANCESLGSSLKAVR